MGMTEDELHRETDLILKKIEGEVLPRVADSERRSAVERAVRLMGAMSHQSIKTILEIVDTNEEQISVHAEPSD